MPPVKKPKDDKQSRLMQLAYDAIKAAKSVTEYTPVRALQHVPEFDAILRPIKPQRVTDLSADILHGGYRTDEQIFTTLPLFDLEIPRHILGGNHRAAAARKAGVVLVPCHPVPRHVLQEMMEEAKKEELPSSSDSQEQKVHRYYKCVKLLMIATQAKSPNPAQHTILQMVSLIRTFVQNDPDITMKSKKNPRAVYGGYKALRHGIYGDIPLHSDNSVHFLLNKHYVEKPRHMNKCLAGAKKLIETKLRKTVPALRNRQTLLDLLLYWEHRDFVPTFNVAHLCHVGELSADQALSIAEETTEFIYNNIRTNPDKISTEDPPFTKKRVVAKAITPKPTTGNNDVSQEDEVATTGNVGTDTAAPRAGSDTPSTDIAAAPQSGGDAPPNTEDEAAADAHNQVPRSSAGATSGGASPAAQDERDEDEDGDEGDDGDEDEDEIVPAQAPSTAPQTPPRRSGRKRTQVVLDDFGGAVAPASKKGKKNTAKKINKHNADRIARLEYELRVQQQMNEQQKKALEHRDRRIEETMKRRVQEKSKARSRLESMQEKLDKEAEELRKKFELDMEKTKASADAQLQKANDAAAEKLRKLKVELANREKSTLEKDRVLLADLRDDTRLELEKEFQAKMERELQLQRDAKIEMLKKENETLKREVEQVAKTSMVQSDKALEGDLQLKRDAEIEALRTENAKLKRDGEQVAKSSMVQSDEVEKLRKELNELKEKNAVSSSTAVAPVTAELDRLRKENDELKKQFQERASERADTSRARRNVFPTDKALQQLPKKDLEAFLKRANRILSGKNES